ncbi:hypothetical protein [uncultured Williamsia sp.]|uniref:hypothetical protein n=1 Tax=uncultured Williamsia sp. TaxID=259311 RepID=UPI0026363860|nr:hypothetical protein [uncultured Williamsia sp.]
MRVRARATSVAVPAVVAAMVIGGSVSGAAGAGTPPTYRVAVSDDGNITSALSGAVFRAAPDGLVVTDTRGRVLDRIPTSVPLDGTPVALRTTLGAGGRTATLTPVLPTAVATALKQGRHPVSKAKDRAYYDMLFHVANGLNRAGTVAAAAGAGVGTVVGAAVGLVVGCTVFGACLLAVPGAAVGAAIGAGVAGVVGTQYGDPRAAQSVLTWITTR